MPEAVQQILILSILAPLALSALLYLAAWRPWKGADGPRGLWAAPIAIGAAHLLAYVGVDGFPAFPPAAAAGWAALLAPVAAVVALVTIYFRRRPLITWTLRALLVVGGIWTITQPLFEHTWTVGAGWGWIALFTVFILGVWYALDRLAARERGVGVPLTLALAIGGGAAVVAIAATFSTGVYAGAIAIATGFAAIVALWRGEADARPAVATAVPLVGFLWVIAAVYSDTSPYALALLALAPLSAWMMRLGPLKVRSGWLRPTLSVVGALLLVGAGFVVAETALAPSSGADGGEVEVDESGSYVPY